MMNIKPYLFIIFINIQQIMDWESSDSGYLENKFFIETVIIKCICANLSYALKSTQTQIEFLKIIVESNLNEIFSGL